MRPRAGGAAPGYALRVIASAMGKRLSDQQHNLTHKAGRNNVHDFTLKLGSLCLV